MISPLSDTHGWFKLAVPEPTLKNLQVQLGVHFEEVHEMLVEVSGKDERTITLLAKAEDGLLALANHLKQNTEVVVSLPDRRAVLDAVCDQLVTATGVAYMMGMDPLGGLAEVNRSNWSKFVDGKPNFNENGKILKGEGYSPPDLTPFL